MPLKVPDFSRLLTTLNNTGLAADKNNLYQFLKQQLDLLVQFAKSISDLSSSQDSKNTVLTNATYLTASDESSILPFSRELIAGTGITFDDSIANRRTISSSGEGIHPFLLMGG